MRQQMHEMHKLLRKQHSPEWWHAGQPPPPPPHATTAARLPLVPSTSPARTTPPWSPLGLPSPPQATAEPTAMVEQLERKVAHAHERLQPEMTCACCMHVHVHAHAHVCTTYAVHVHVYRHVACLHVHVHRIYTRCTYTARAQGCSSSPPPRRGQVESLSLQLEHLQRENRELRASLSPAPSQQVVAASQPTAARTPESRWSFLRLRRSARRAPHSGGAKNAHVQHHASRSPARGDGGGALSFARSFPPLAGGEPAGDKRLGGAGSVTSAWAELARSELSHGRSVAAGESPSRGTASLGEGTGSPQFGPSLAI